MCYGPDSAEIMYHAEQRFIDSDSGGTTAPTSLNSTAPVTVTPTTTSSATSPLTDSATLSGGVSPGGTITFYLFAPGVTPNGTDSNNVYSDTVTITGDGTYTTSQGNHPGGYVPTAVGTYQWVAVYSGDAKNSGATSPFGSEPECVTAMSSTITGSKYLDLTGNGFSSDDTGLGGVTINLYTTIGGKAVATATTASDGSYAFNNLAAGTYYVQESVPTGYIQTGGGPNGSAGSTYYTIQVQAGQIYTGNNFDDFQIPTCAPTCVSYTIDNNNCLTTVGDLRGNTDQGDTVTVTFSTGNMSDQLTLVSYIAPGPSFDSTTAYQQQIFDVASGTFAANGTYSLTVLIPNCDYQIDFICGPAINVLGPQNYGPDSANIFYSAESRLLSADNDGTKTFSTKPVAAGDFATTALWTTSNGKTLLDKLNGNSNSTQLAHWLATTFPNLYGPSAGSHSLVNSNGTYFTNSQVVTAYSSKFSGGDQQVLSAALSLYSTSINFAGSSAASYAKSPVGLNTSLYGSAMDTYCVGTNGAAFGLANNTVTTVMQLLVDLNANTSAGATVSSGANAVFSGVNTAGNVTNADLSSDGLAYTPDQVRTAYGINSLSLDGTGQTIAIVDAYDDPAIFQAVDDYDNQFGLTSSGPTLYQQYGASSSFLTVLGQDGTTTDLPAVDPTGGWEMEEALDVEWIHAIAPGADHSCRGQQPIAVGLDEQRGHGRQPTQRVRGFDELGPHGRPERDRPGRIALRPGPDHTGRPSGRDLRGQHRRLRGRRPRISRLLPQRGGGRRYVPCISTPTVRTTARRVGVTPTTARACSSAAAAAPASTKPSRPTNWASSPRDSGPRPTSPSWPTRPPGRGSPIRTTSPATTRLRSWAGPAWRPRPGPACSPWPTKGERQPANRR